MLIKVRKKPGGSHISKDALSFFWDTLSKNEAVEDINVSFVGDVEDVVVPSSFGTPQ